MINQKIFKQILPKLYSICQETGQLQMKHHKSNISFSTKDNKTPVTEIDIKSNSIITKGLNELTPSIPIISEEDYEGQEKHNYFWIIDPLDGTRNYIDNGNEFCICISLIDKESPILGIIYSPVTKDFFYSYKDLGAFHQAKSSKPKRLTTKKMTDSTDLNIFTSSSIRKSAELILGSKFPNCNFIKRSSAIKFGSIARGDGIFYPRLGPTHEWDTAAGHSIVNEAGGAVVDKNMKPLKYNKNKSFLNNEFFVISDPSYDWKSIIDSIVS